MYIIMFKNLIGNIINKGINKCGLDLIENIQKFISDEYKNNKLTPTNLTDNFYKKLCEEKKTKELLEEIRKTYNIEQRNKCLESTPDTKKIMDCNELNFSITNINIGYIRGQIEEMQFTCNPTALHMISVFVDHFLKVFFELSTHEESKKKSKTKKHYIANLNLKRLCDSPLIAIFEESDCFKELRRENNNYMDLKKLIPENEEKQFKKHMDKLYNTKEHTYEFHKDYFALILDVIYSFLTYVIKSIINYTNTVIVKKRTINETHFQMCIQQLVDRIGNKNLNKIIDNIWNEYKQILEDKKSKPKKSSAKKKKSTDEKEQPATTTPTPTTSQDQKEQSSTQQPSTQQPTPTPVISPTILDELNEI